MKLFLKSTASALILALSLSTLAPAQDAEPTKEEMEKLMGEFQETFGNMLQQALEDALKGWDKNGGDPKEFEDLLGRLFQGGGESELSQKDLEKWLGDDFMKRLKDGLGGEGDPLKDLDFGKNVEPGDLEGFARLLNGLGNLRRPGSFEKENKEILEVYRPVAETGSRSTARILIGKKQIALATIISADGYLLTKASELGNKDTFSCQLNGGLEIDAKLLDVHVPYDLALLKINADGLTPVDWAQKNDHVQPGSFVLAPGIDSLPLAVGVVSVLPRSLSDADKGFLGVQLEQKGVTVVIRSVVPGSPADQSGLQAGDHILLVDNVASDTVSGFIDEIKSRHPKDIVKIQYARGDAETTVDVTLSDRSEITNNGAPAGFNPFNSMGGRLSSNRDGFPLALQTDLTLNPEECGGPLLDLDGHAVGINIARSGRVMSYAIPVEAIHEIIGNLPGGKFAQRDIKSLEESNAIALRKLDAARTAFETAEKQAEAAKKALDEARK